MGEKITRRRDMKKLLISLLIGTILLAGLIVSLIILNGAIASGNWDERTTKIYGLLRFFVILSIAVDGFLIAQWIFLIIFRTD